MNTNKTAIGFFSIKRAIKLNVFDKTSIAWIDKRSFGVVAFAILVFRPNLSAHFIRCLRCACFIQLNSAWCTAYLHTDELSRRSTCTHGFIATIQTHLHKKEAYVRHLIRTHCAATLAPCIRLFLHAHTVVHAQKRQHATNDAHHAIAFLFVEKKIKAKASTSLSKENKRQRKKTTRNQNCRNFFGYKR